MTYGEVGLPTGGFSLERPVVVGYNGKRHSQEALAWAASEAARGGRNLLVVYAANYPGMVVDPGPGLLDPEPGALEAAHEITARGVREAREVSPGLQVAGVTEVTSPAQALTEAASDAELLVIGTRGYGRALGAFLGSVAFSVAARAACPVVVVTGQPDARMAGPNRSVVVGTDGSDQAAGAVRFAAHRAATAAAALKIVTCTGGEDLAGADLQQLAAAATVVAHAAAAGVRDAHPNLAVTTHVEDCPPERALVEASTEAGLVVVGTRGRGAFQGLFLGSVSHAVIYGAQCPVAVTPDVER